MRHSGCAFRFREGPIPAISTRRGGQMLKGAMVGFGFIAGKGHHPAYLARKDVEIVAIADVSAARLDAARAAAPDARLYPSWRELLTKETALDFVDVCTPPDAHAEIALAALRRGAHVLCEKPLTTTTAQAMELVAAAREHRRVVFPAHNYKHAPVVKFALDVIRSGRIGSHCMDASHTHWFDSLFDQFKAALQSGDFVGRELREAVACVQIIETCYRSSAEGSRGLPLPLDVLEI